MRTLIHSLVVVLLCSFTTVAMAEAKTDEKLDKAKAAFKAGQALFGASQYAQAAKKFVEAYGHKELPAFLFNAAVCFEKAEQYVEAKKYFVEYLSKAKDIKRLAAIQARIRLIEKLIKYIDDVKQLEVKRKQEEEARKKAIAKAKKLGKKPPKKLPPKNVAPPPKPKPVLPPISTKNIVTVQTEPAGALVYLDDATKSAGVTPLQLEVPKGKHLLTIKMKGFSPLKREITITPNRMLELFMNLKKESKLAWIRVTSSSGAADIYLDDKKTGPIGKAPYSGFVPKGKHMLYVSAAGYREKQIEIAPIPGENNSYHVSLEKLPIAYISIYGNNVRNAKVRIGKKVICVAPCLKVKVPSGQHLLRISKKGMKPVERRISLSKGDHKNFSVSLYKAPNRVGAITAYIIGLAALGGGAYLANMGNTIKSDWDKKVESGIPVYSNDEKLKDAKIYYVGANVLFGLSALSFVIAVYRTFADSSPDSKIIQTLNIGTTTVSVNPMFTPSGSGISLTFSY